MAGDRTLRFRLEADERGVIRAIEEVVAAGKAAERELDGIHATPEVDLDITELLREKKRAEAELKLLGKAKAEAKAELDTKVFDAQAAKVQATIDHIDGQVAEVKVRTDRSELDRGADAISRVTKSVGENDSRLVSWLRSLSKVRIQMGFLSGTVKQFGIAFTVLAPVLAHLVGAASALVGVVGSGAVGAFAAGTAAAGGFALSALGVGLAIRPVVKDIGAAMTATKAYNDAVLKYGRGSTEAATAQDKLNQTLKGVSPMARKAIKDFGGLSTEWTKLTAGARRPIFDAFAQGIKTVHALLPSFAKQSVATTKVLSAGIQDWMKSLRSPEAQAAINQMMSGFRGALPGIMDGLGSIAALLGRIGASASRLLPGLTGGFADWANSLEKSVGRGARLDSWVDRTIQHMRDLGHMTQSAGRLLVGFFGAGAKSGDRMVRTLTDTLDRWNAWVRSARGQTSLHEFFDKSVTESGKILDTLAHLTTVMYSLGRAVQPFSDGIVRIADAISGILALVSGNPLGRLFIQGMGSALALLFIINKVRTALLGMEALSLGGMLFGTGRAAKTGSALTTIERFAPALAGISAPAAAAGAALAGLGVVAVVASRHWDKANDDFNRVRANIGGAAPDLANAEGQIADGMRELSAATSRQRAAVQSLPPAFTSYHTKLLMARQAQQALNQAQKQYGPQSNQAKQATIQYARALDQLVPQARKFKDEARQTFNTAQDRVKAARGSLQDFNDEVRSARQHQDALNVSSRGNRFADQAKAGAAGTRELNRSLTEQEAAQHRLRRAEAERAGALVQFQRLMQGMGPLTDRARIAAGQFVRQFQGIKGMKKLAITADSSRAVERLRDVSRLSQKVVGRKQTIQILANSRNADQAIRRTEANLRRVARRKYEAVLEANDKPARGRAQSLAAHLIAVARHKYQATLDAIDKTSSPVRRAVSKINAAKGKLTIDGDAGPATAAARSAVAQINGMSASIYVGLRGPGAGRAAGRAQGGESEYATVTQPGGSQKVNRPTMLTGEEGPQHPEFVIATNPAYRNSNTAYLDQAATALGFALIPAFKKGGIHPAKSAKTGGMGVDAAQNRKDKTGSAVQKLKDKKSAAKSDKKDKKHWSGKDEKHLKQAKHRDKQAAANLKAANAFEKGLTTLSNRFDYFHSKMTEAEDAGDAQHWTSYKSSASNAAQDVINAISKAIKHTGQGAKGGGRLWELRAMIADWEATKGDVDRDVYGEEATPGASVAEQTVFSNQARADFQRQFGSNLIGGLLPAVAGGISRAIAPASAGFYPTGQSTQFPGGSSLTGPNETPGRIVNINNNFAAPPPDPHTWTQQQNFEAQVAM